jgi:hypothetical protein
VHAWACGRGYECAGVGVARARSCACSFHYLACNAHAPYCLQPLALSHKHHDFRGKVLFQVCLILRRIQRDILLNFKTSSRKVPALLVGF